MAGAESEAEAEAEWRHGRGGGEARHGLGVWVVNAEQDEWEETMRQRCFSKLYSLRIFCTNILYFGSISFSGTIKL